MFTLNLLDDSILFRLALTLAHFVWQGTLIWLLLLVADRFLRHRTANSRYAVYVAAMLLMLGVSIGTFAMLDVSQTSKRSVGQNSDGPIDWREGAFVSGGREAVRIGRSAATTKIRAKRYLAIAEFHSWLEEEHSDLARLLDPNASKLRAPTRKDGPRDKSGDKSGDKTGDKTGDKKDGDEQASDKAGSSTSGDEPVSRDAVRASRIQGQLVDRLGKGDPTAGVTVFLCDAKTGLPVLSKTKTPLVMGTTDEGWIVGMWHALTDASGKFTFDDVPPGTYRLVAQAWDGDAGIPWAKKTGGGPFGKTSTTVRLYGVAENVGVVEGKSIRLAIAPLGKGVLKIVNDPGEAGAFLFVSSGKPLGDPILGPLGWGPDFIPQIMAITHMSEPHVTLLGLPDGKDIHTSLLNYDNNPGIGGGSYRVGRQAEVKLKIYASWSNGHIDPPQRLRPLVDYLEKNAINVQRMLGINRAKSGAYENLRRLVETESDREVSLDGFGKTRLIELVTAARFQMIRKHSRALGRKIGEKEEPATTQPDETDFDPSDDDASVKENPGNTSDGSDEEPDSDPDDDKNAIDQKADKNSGDKKAGEEKADEENPEKKPAEINTPKKNAGPKPVTEISCTVTGPGGPLEKATVDVKIWVGEQNVFLIPQKPTHELQYTTNEQGEYTIEVPKEMQGLKDLQVSVDIHHPDVLDRSIGPVPVDDFRPDNGQRRPNVAIYRDMAKRGMLHSRLRAGRQIHGVVLLPDGKPAVGAQLKIGTKYRAYSWKHFSPDDYGAYDSVETDEEGRFSAYVDTTISMTILMRGYAPTLVDDYDKRVPIVGEDANTFILTRGVRVRGRVLDAEGNPVPRAVVRATRKFEWNEFDMPLSMARLCAANEKGEYELPPLPADTYSFATSSRLTAESDIEAYNDDNAWRMVAGDFTVLLPDKRPYAIEPVPQVVLPDLRALDPGKPFVQLDLKATSVVKVKVKVEFPDGTPDPDRAADVGIAGMYDGSVWNGKYVVADEDGNATLLAPKGLDEVKIKTGVALHRRTADSPLEIGQAIHLIKLGRDMDGFVVVKPKFAKLKVNLKLAQGFQAGERISFRTEYDRMGYGEHSPNKKKMHLFGSRQSRSTYEASAIPNEPFTLRVVKNIGTETVLLHEQQLTLKPGEERVLEIPIGK